MDWKVQRVPVYHLISEAWLVIESCIYTLTTCLSKRFKQENDRTQGDPRKMIFPMVADGRMDGEDRQEADR